ncbi:MAG: GNAT family N-acetyltransferase [Treponema sp.]|jgi:predicted N-acyltransferase|nr:GNAT family N-acetyltransferase [Treponema sp.]
MGKTRYKLEILRSITGISAEKWNSLVTPETLPFLEWEWLAALEESGSIAPETGWHPLHFCLWEGDRLAAAAPFYLKTNSDGEYVYDYFWAEAAQSLGRRWYPKLVGAPAATPAEGYRFLHAPGLDGEALTALILEAAENICRQNGIVSLNLLFADPLWAQTLPRLGYSPWEHSHYVWENPGYAGFEDYLSIFSKNQRKNIRKEYRRHGEQDISIRIINGEDAGEDMFRRMFELFTITNDKFAPWDARWVNEEFFLRLEKTCRRRAAFVEASRNGSGEILAMAFLVRKGDRMWGRYWGAYEEVRDLHFAACYYAPMDWCIREGIRTFDPGAGSPHKIRRGFRAVTDRSWHKFFDPRLERLFADNIDAVNQYEAENRRILNAELPFKEHPAHEGLDRND